MLPQLRITKMDFRMLYSRHGGNHHSRKGGWVVARRVFDPLLERAQDQLSGRPDLVTELTAAKALDGLHLGSIAPADCKLVVQALETAIDGFLADLTAHDQDQRAAGYAKVLIDLRERLQGLQTAPPRQG
jgi:hypothetical protein